MNIPSGMDKPDLRSKAAAVTAVAVMVDVGIFTSSKPFVEENMKLSLYDWSLTVASGGRSRRRSRELFAVVRIR